MQALHVLQSAQLPIQLDFPHPEKFPKQLEHCFENPNLFFIQSPTHSASPQQVVPQESKVAFVSFLLLSQICLSSLSHKPSENTSLDNNCLCIKLLLSIKDNKISKRQKIVKKILFNYLHHNHLSVGPEDFSLIVLKMFPCWNVWIGYPRVILNQLW
jgi:hypothetical protein